MKNYKNILLLLLILFSIEGVAQEGLLLKPLNQDTSQLQIERQIEYRQLISGDFNTSLFPEKPGFQTYKPNFEFPKTVSFNFNNWNQNGSVYPGFRSIVFYPFYSPFFNNAAVLSEGAFKLNDKFMLGGFSYGTNSIFSGTQLLTPGTNKFDHYGSTLFMQYKFSKNFKIETRVNVSQGGLYPGF